MGHDRDPPRAVVVLRLGGGGAVTLGTVDRAVPCDLDLVERLLRLQLVAKRAGWAVELLVVCPELRRLFDVAGLAGQLE
jgi:hypothetical protein